MTFSSKIKNQLSKIIKSDLIIKILSSKNLLAESIDSLHNLDNILKIADYNMIINF